MLNKLFIHDGIATDETSTSGKVNIAGIFVGKSQFTRSTSNFNWIVDSREIDHIIGTTSLLNHGLTVKSSGQVQLSNGDSAKVTHSGGSQLQGGNAVQNVLCVPDFNFNLLSMAKLSRKLQCCAIFYLDFYLLQDLFILFIEKLKDICEEDDVLYILKSSQL